jgi:hypothetical protein
MRVQIIAGDYIDFYIGSAFALSTMAAAGLGNMVSDVAGIYCADVIEDRARIFKYGRFPHLSPVQKRLPSVVCAHRFACYRFRWLGMSLRLLCTSQCHWNDYRSLYQALMLAGFALPIPARDYNTLHMAKRSVALRLAVARG